MNGPVNKMKPISPIKQLDLDLPSKVHLQCQYFHSLQNTSWVFYFFNNDPLSSFSQSTTLIEEKKGIKHLSIKCPLQKEKKKQFAI